MKNIVLVGFMGAGKTTVARELERMAGLSVLDTDEQIVREDGRSIADIFAQDGEEAFRQMETRTLEKIACSDAAGMVVSVGGGLPCREKNRRLMKKIGHCFYLKAPADVLCARLQADRSRPVLLGKSGDDLKQHVLRLMDRREAAYMAAADTVLDTWGLTPSMTARQILSIMQRMEKRV